MYSYLHMVFLWGEKALLSRWRRKASYHNWIKSYKQFVRHRKFKFDAISGIFTRINQKVHLTRLIWGKIHKHYWQRPSLIDRDYTVNNSLLTGISEIGEVKENWGRPPNFTCIPNISSNCCQEQNWGRLPFEKFRSSSIFKNIEVVFHNSTSWVKIWFHTENQNV